MGKRDYVVPMPRVTDTVGQALRRAFVAREDVVFSDLLARLDAIA